MIVLWFILGIILITCIARYNESNKLFWTLLFSFVIGFAGTKMVLDTINGEERSNVSFVQQDPTQVSIEVLNANTHFITITDTTNNVVTAQNPVSQEIVEDNKADVILSKISERTRDQPRLNLLKPPEFMLTEGYFNTC